MSEELAGVLVLIGRDGARGELPIGRRPVVVGRDPWVDVVVRHPSISRHHAMLWADGDQLFVRDLGASCGTWVGGRLLSAGESAHVRKRQAVGLGGALEFKWKVPTGDRAAIHTSGRVVLEPAEVGWQLVEAPASAETTHLSETSPGPQTFADEWDDATDLIPQSAALRAEDDIDLPTEPSIRGVPGGGPVSDEVPTARIKAMGDLLMGASQELEDFKATASLPAMPAAPEDAVVTGPQQSVGPVRVVFTGKSGVVEETNSGNRTRVRGESRVELLRVLALRLAAYRKGEHQSPRVTDQDLALCLWPSEVGDAGPRIELLIRRLQRQLRQAGLPQDLVTRDPDGTRLLPTCAVPPLPPA